MRKALVVGIDNYPASPLKGCTNDATAFADVIAVNGYGSPNFDVLKKCNVENKADLKGLIEDLFNGDSEIALLYFSGHGFIDSCAGYIATPDFKQKDPGVSMDEILTLANQSRSRNRVVILDCCYSGAFGSPMVNGGKTAQVKEGVTILTSCRDYEQSVEIQGHGLFTSLLLDAMRGGAADLRGHITPGSVYAYIDQALGPWEQRPVFITNVSQFVSLRKTTPQVAIEILRRIIKYFPTPDFDYHLDPSYEFTNTHGSGHKSSEPYADPAHVPVFKDLQKLESVGLVIPVGEEHMYFAAMNSRSCRLTTLGHHYWRLVKEKRI